MTQNGGNTHYSLRLSQSMYNRNTLFRHDTNRKPTQPTKGDHRYSLPLKPTTQNTTPAIKRNITRLQNISNRDNARQNSSYYRTSRKRTTSLLHSNQHTMSKSQPPAYRGKSLRAISRNTKNLPLRTRRPSSIPTALPATESKALFPITTSARLLHLLHQKTCPHSTTQPYRPHEPTPTSRQE